MAKKLSSNNNRVFTAQDLTWETTEDQRVIGWIGPKDAEKVAVFGLWHQTAEALMALFEMVEGDVYKFHQVWPLGSAWGGMHLKFDPKDENAPATMRSAGYVSHGYKGDLVDCPDQMGWTEVRRESWQNLLGRFQKMVEPELGEADSVTKARDVNRKMNAMTYLCAGYTLKLTGMIFNEEAGAPDVEKTIKYYELCAETMALPVAEARKAMQEKRDAKIVYRTDGKIGANPELQAAVLKATEFLPTLDGGQIAVVDLLGHTVRGSRNGLLLGGQHEVDESNLGFVVTHMKRNRLAVVIIA